MCEKAAYIQRKTLNNFQKVWGTIAHDYFEILQDNLAPGRKTYKE